MVGILHTHTHTHIYVYIYIFHVFSSSNCHTVESFRSTECVGNITIYLGTSDYPPVTDKKLVYCGQVSQLDIEESPKLVTLGCVIPMPANFVYVAANISGGGPLAICGITVTIAGKHFFEHLCMFG